MLVTICVHPICIILLLWNKYSTPFYHQRNWPAAPQEPMVAITFRPSARPQPSTRLQFPVPIGPTQPIKPANPVPPSHFKPKRQVLWALPSPPSHFWTDTPCQALWASPVVPQHITCPSKPLLNQHAKRCEPVPSFLIILPAPPSIFWTNTLIAVSQSRNFSSDYLPLQAIFEPTRQAIWANSVILHRIHHSSMTPLA